MYLHLCSSTNIQLFIFRTNYDTHATAARHVRHAPASRDFVAVGIAGWNCYLISLCDKIGNRLRGTKLLCCASHSNRTNAVVAAATISAWNARQPSTFPTCTTQHARATSDVVCDC